MQKGATKRLPQDEPANGLQQTLGMNEEETAVVQVGRQVLDFMSRTAAFLTAARHIEVKAKATLTTAQTLRVPTTALDDEMMQRFVLGAADGIKEAEAHWGICQIISRFHKLTTSARARSVDAFSEARTIGNNLHNTYTRAEQRRAQEENDRLHHEEEQRAQAARDKELADAEALALKRESASKDLSEREMMFVDLVFDGRTGAAAAQKAGYKDPVGAADRLLGALKIQKALGAKQEAKTIREQAAAKAAKPLDVQHQEVRPDITRATGAKDRTTKSAEIVDANALIAACIQGGYGIPWDILDVKPAKLNEYARSMGALINKWPGVRYKEETGVTR